MQPDECREALSELSGRSDHKVLLSLLDRIKELAARTATLGLVMKLNENGDAIDYEERLALLKRRIDAARASLS